MDILDKHKSEIEIFCKKNGIIKISLFGSSLSKSDYSDIDLLVEFDEDSLSDCLT